MKLFRKNNKWLRYRTFFHLRQNNKDLYEPTRKSAIRKFKNFVSESNQWWFVFLLVLTLFLLSLLINFDFLNFLTIDFKTAVVIVDQRTANIAAIISITLVVVNFIITNLAQKSPVVLSLLFKKTFLYPIIYFTLSVIGIFIAISTLRDTLSSFVFTRLVLAGTYLAISILFLIGMLFKKILFFSNKKEIVKILDEELIIEAKENLKDILSRKLSEKIFVLTMQEKGAKEYDWSYSWGKSTQINFLENKITIEGIKTQKEKLVDDVNLTSLSNFIKNKNTNEEILYQKLSLDKIVTDIDNFIWSQNKENTKKEKTKLQRSLVLKGKPKKQKNNDAMRKYYDDEFKRFSEQDDYRSMEQSLKSYLKLYELQIQNQIFADNTDITDGIVSIVWKAIDEAISKNSVESFHVLESFVGRVLYISIRDNSLKHFNIYKSFPALYYNISYEKAKHDPSLSKIHKICSENAAIKLKGIIGFDINSTFRNKDNANDRANTTLLAFQGFSELLYSIVKNGDINQFKFALNQFEQISENNDPQQFYLEGEIRDLRQNNSNGQNNETIEAKKEGLNVLKQLKNYKRHVLVGIKYWILFLYEKDKIDENTVLQFLQRIQIPYTNSDDLLSDILLFRDISRFDNNYMGWDNWDYIERQSGIVYYPPEPRQWITLGFFADLIREKRFFVNVSELNSEEISQARFLFDDLKQNAKHFENSLEKWKNILLVENIESYKEKSNKILEDFALIKRKIVTDTDRVIACASLYPPHIESFKNMIGNAWKSQARIHRSFKYFGNTLNVNGQEVKLKLIGKSIFFEKAKIMFTQENHQTIHGMDSMGGEIGRWEDNHFLSIIREVDHNRISATSILEALNKSIDELKNRKKTPNFILISDKYYRYSHRDEKFLKSELFKSKLNNSMPKNDLESFCIGTFDGIPVYTSSSESLNNLILVCNFNEAFQQHYKTNENWFEKELNVDVKLVTDEIAQKELEENHAKWTTLDEDGKTLTDAEALLLIKTSIIIDIWTTVDYKIKDKHAYILGYIKTDNEE